VRNGNLSGTKRHVKERNVTEDGDEGSLEEKTEVGSVVDHTLLGDGEVSGLADHEIGPLDAHNGDEVGSLSVSQSLGSVADLDTRDVRVSVESGVTITLHPSALREVSLGAASVEESEINSVHVDGIPVELSSEVRVHVVGVTVAQSTWGVDIGRLRDVTVLESEEPGGPWSETVIVENVEVGVETSGSLDHTNLQVSEGDKLGVHKMVTLGVTWVSLHDIKFGVLISKGNGWHHISSQINAKNEDSGKRKRNLEQDEEEERSDLGNVGGEGVSNGLLDPL